MISFEKALEIIRANTIILGTETIRLEESLNRVLRQDVVSDIDMPPFEKAAMDGYACRRHDLENVLEVIEVIPAGYQPKLAIGSNQCSKIMTGAMLPDGADCVIIVEEVEEVAERKIRFKGRQTAANICRRGEDVVVGQRLVPSGTRITPKEIAALALAGCAQPTVCRKPRVGIVATGDEIVEPRFVPKRSQIRNSSSCQLQAQCLEFGCEPTYYGIVRDTRDTIGSMIARAKKESDLILVTGGVSMGEFDLVPSVLKEGGFTVHFEKVAIQPGKPTVFGQAGNRYVFGLPGNPVSSFLVFEVLVKEFLSGAMGLKNYARLARCPLAKTFKRKTSARRAWIPVRMTPEGSVEPVEYHGSAHITSLAGADGFISVPVGVEEIPEGSIVDVRQLPPLA
jgi:molybdopterin molybdotransferase